MTQERCTSGFFTAEADGAAEQTRDEPLETDWNFHELAAQIGNDAVNHRRRHQRLTDRGLLRPARTVCEEVVNGNGQVVVRVH